MSRPIKFRAWDKANKEMVMVRCLEWDAMMKPALSSYIDGPLMQFTGLHDKNGKEIWEGDVVQQVLGSSFFDSNSNRWIPDNEENKGEVVYKCDGFWVNDIRLGDDRVQLASGEADEERLDLEVLGNIYENPELLK